MRNRYARLLPAALILTACAGAGTAGSAGPTSSRDIITAAEIEAAGPQIQTAWDAVEQLRPHFLRERPNPTMGVGAAQVDPVQIYVDGVRRGGPAELRRIRANEIDRIRYIRPADAQTRYGLGHSSGVIDVTLTGGA